MWICFPINFFSLASYLAGYDWNKGVSYEALLETYRFCGFQATNFGLAVEEINKMVCSSI
jgi:deoxyhypusine synthase